MRVLTISGFFSHEPYHTWRRTGFVRMLLQTGAARDSKVPDAPTLGELMDKFGVSEAGRGLAQVILSGAQFGRPWIAPPGVPQDRLRMLRQAFLKAARDPASAVEAKTRDLGYHGLLAELDEDIAPMTDLRLEINLSLLGKKSTDVYAKVLKSFRVDGRQLCGIEFTSTDSSTAFDIQRFVQLLLQGSSTR